MLYLNNEKLTHENFPEQWKDHETKIQDIKKMRNPVIFKTTHLIRRNATGVLEPPKRCNILLRSKIDGKYGSETWVYTETPPDIDAKGNVLYAKIDEIIERFISINPQEKPDFIYYLLYKSIDVKHGRLVFEDKEKESRERVSKSAIETDVEFMIKSSFSPLSPSQNKGDESIIRNKAAAWGVPYALDPNIIGLYTLMEELHAVVRFNEQNKASTGMGYEEFLREDALDGQIKNRAKIQKAIDTRTISYNSDEGTWIFSDGTVFIVVPPKHRQIPEAYLRKEVSLQRDKMRVLESEMGDIEDDEISKYTITEADIESAKTMKELKNMVRFFEPEYNFLHKGIDDLKVYLYDKIKK